MNYYEIYRETFNYSRFKGNQNLYFSQRTQFDIRQWVVVSCLDPLTIWFFDECYIRFGAEKYNVNKLNEKFAHLTNNSIVKYSENFGKYIKGCMWSEKQLSDYLKQINEGTDVFQYKVKPQMKEIAAKVFQGNKISKRNKTFEVFGIDFMIDEKFKVWLIEINKSPALEYSTVITERMSRQLQRDMAKLVDTLYTNDRVSLFDRQTVSNIKSSQKSQNSHKTIKQLGNLKLIYKNKFYKT